MTDSSWYELRNAVYQKEFANAKKLLDANANLVELRNSIGETVLHFLAVENDMEGVEWLFSRGFSINTRTHFGTPLIFEIASLGYKDLVMWFIEHGADPCAIDGEGQTILDYLGNHPRNGEEITALLLKNVPSLRGRHSATDSQIN